MQDGIVYARAADEKQVESDKSKNMKKTINAAIGGCSFTIDEDAYDRLEEYLDSFSSGMENCLARKTAAEELEIRIADLLKEKMGRREVVDIHTVNAVLEQTGPVSCERNSQEQCYEKNRDRVRKFYRDREGKKIAGVCSGLSLYLNIDVTLIRILFLIAFIFGFAGFWIYLVLWIIAPEARTAAEKCELRGIPPTAVNIRRFTQEQ